MFLNLVPEFVDALTCVGRGQQYGRAPLGTVYGHVKHTGDGCRHLVGPVTVSLVYQVKVGNLHHSGF